MVTITKNKKHCVRGDYSVIPESPTLNARPPKSLFSLDIFPSYHMAKNRNTDQKTPSNPEVFETPESGNDIRISSNCQDPKKEDCPDTLREHKRRKNCPRSLDSIHESPNLNFTFDTKFVNGFPSQFTPKFGSFNLLFYAEEKVGEGEEQQEEQKEAAEAEILEGSAKLWVYGREGLLGVD